jgi:hypothetical protein
VSPEIGGRDLLGYVPGVQRRYRLPLNLNGCCLRVLEAPRLFASVVFAPCRGWYFNQPGFQSRQQICLAEMLIVFQAERRLELLPGSFLRQKPRPFQGKGGGLLKARE